MPADTLLGVLDDSLRDIPPSRVVLCTAGSVVAAYTLSQLLADGNLFHRSTQALFRGVRYALDGLIIQKKINDAAKGLHFPSAKGEPNFLAIPDRGLKPEEVLAASDFYHEHLDKKMGNSLLSGVVYWGTVNHHSTMMKLLDKHLWANPLFADYFGATRKMEAEVTAMTLNLFHGNSSTMAATYTYGGSESVVLSMLAYRNYGQQVLGIQHPEVVICDTAHPAFDKAEQYFGLKLVKVPMDPVTKKMDLKAAERALTSKTVALVGSAPCFPYGSIDDIAGLTKIAKRHSIACGGRFVGVHVDACLGGYLVQFMADAGFADVPTIDFRLDGVTSISADIHKWGGSPKGASCVMFRTRELRAQSTFAFADYPGGLYVTAGVAGSRPGFIASCAWGALLLTGREGFVSAVRDVVSTTRKIANGISSIEGLRLLTPTVETSVVPFTSDVLDIYVLMKRLGEEHGFLLNPLQFPCGVHLGVTMEHAKPGAAEAFLAAVKTVVDDMLSTTGPQKVKKHDALIYGSTQGVPDRSIINDVLRRYVDAYFNVKK